MLRKFKIRPLLMALAAAALLCGGAAVRGRDARLNRTVRNVALRLVQIERLSRTTGVDYRVVFHADALEVEVFDPESNGWRFELRKPYTGKSRCAEPGFAFVFSRGFFRSFDAGGEDRRPPRYVIVEFSYPGLSRKGRIMFHRKGDWRVLG